MRSLNTSLPKSSSKRQKSSYPQAGLKQAFKAAAFSVTQLYKAAAAEEDSAQAAGYQAAIDELLGFLDAENLGLGDGEGWRVRQWATERLTPNIYGSDSDEEEDGGVEPKHTASTSDEVGVIPNDQPNTSTDKEYTAQQQASADTATTQSTRITPTTGSDDRPRHSSTFQFTANPQSSDIDMSASSPTTMAPPTSLRLNLRPSRQPKQRRRSRESSQPRAQSLGLGAGLKRKSSSNFDFPDFAGFEKDWHGHGGGGGGGGGGAKRGRWE